MPLQEAVHSNLLLTSKRSLFATKSTASCSSPNELTHAVPLQEAVLTLKEMVLSASPMHIISLMRFLSGVAFVKNSSCTNSIRTSNPYTKPIGTHHMLFLSCRQKLYQTVSDLALGYEGGSSSSSRSPLRPLRRHPQGFAEQRA